METKNEIEVLTKEQIEQFPEVVRNNIAVLELGSRPGELVEFNPLVSGLITLKEKALKLKMLPAVEGVFDKDNVQQFIDLKKDIKSYRANVKTVSTNMKRPRLDENKSINAIEKTFIADATVLFDAAEKEFDPYVKAQEEKARLAKEKKDKALNDKIKEQQEQLDIQKRKNESSQVFNKIKYTLIAENITAATSEAILKSNESTLVQMQAGFVRETFETLTKGCDMEFLSDELISELKLSFEKSKKLSIDLIGNKLESLETERENIVLETQNESAKEQLVEASRKIDEVIVPDIPAPPNHIPVIESTITDDEFVRNTLSEINIISDKVNARINSGVICSPYVYTLQNLLKSFSPPIS